MPNSLTSSTKSSSKSTKQQSNTNGSIISGASGPENPPETGSPDDGSLGSSGNRRIIPKRLNSLEEIAQLEEQAAQNRDETGDVHDEDDNRSTHNVTVIDSAPTNNNEGGCDRCTNCGTMTKSTIDRQSLHKHKLSPDGLSNENLSLAHQSVHKEMLTHDMIQAPLPLPPQKIRRRRQKTGSDQIYKLNMFSWTELSLRRMLWNLGDSIGQYGSLLMILPLLAFILCTIGLIVKRNEFNYETSIDSMYVRESQSAAKFSRKVLTEQGLPMFNYSNPAFDAIDRRAKSDFGVIMKVSRHGKTILEAENTEAYSALRQRIELLTVAEDRKVHSYKDLCRRDCADTLALMTDSPSSVSMTYPETFIDYINGTVRRIYLGSTFGGVETNPDGGIARARSLAMYYRLSEPKFESDYTLSWHYDDLAEFDRENKEVIQPSPVLDKWSEEFDNTLAESQAEPLFGRLQLSWWSYDSFLQAVSDGFANVYFLCIFSGLIFGFLVFIACARKDSYSSRPGLAIMIIAVIVLSNLGGLSVHFGISAQFEPTNVAVFFFFTAFALLLTLNGMHSWHKYNNIAVHPVEKLKFILTYEGPCFVAICLIGIASFVITALVTELDYFRNTCFLVACIVTLFLLLQSLVFFVGLYITGKRESAGLKWFQFWQTGDDKFPAMTIELCDRKELDELHRRLCDQEPNIWRQMGSACSTVHFRFMTILLVSIYLIFAIWGCSIANVELKEDHLLPSDSMPQMYLNDYRQFYGRNEEYVELIFDDVLDYMNANTRAAIFNLIEWAQKEKYAARAVSWLADFVSFNRTTRYEVRPDTFVAVVNRVFLRSSRYEAYAADIAFAPLHTQIIASRMYLQLTPKAQDNPMPLITGLMQMAKEAELPLRIRAPSIFLLAHDYQIRDLTIIAFAILLCLISFGTLLCMAEPFSTLLALLACIMTAVGTIGLGALWQVPFNALTAVTVLVGMLYTGAVSYTFCYHFINAGPSCKPAQRMEYAFFTCAPPMLWSMSITILAFMPLLASGTPMITHMAKLIALHLVLSLCHIGFVIAPAMLLISDQIPRGCNLARSCVGETCCACCDMEEDSASIYYIPTGTVTRSMDHETLQKCIRSTYGDNVHVLEPLALPGPHQPRAIMPPPGPVVTEPDGMLVGYSRVVRRNGRSSIVSSAANSTQGTPTRTRRHVRQSPKPEPSEKSTRREFSPQPSTPTRRESHRSRRNSTDLSHVNNVDTESMDGDAIYEEPPPLPDPNPRSQRHQQRRSSENHHHQRYQGSRSNQGSMDLQPNWRQYMLDGNVRRHAVVEVPPMPMMGLMPGGAPQIITLGPPPPQQAFVHGAAAPPRYRRSMAY